MRSPLPAENVGVKRRGDTTRQKKQKQATEEIFHIWLHTDPEWLWPCCLSEPPGTPSRRNSWLVGRLRGGWDILLGRRRRSWCAGRGSADTLCLLAQTQAAAGCLCSDAWRCQPAARPGSRAATETQHRKKKVSSLCTASDSTNRSTEYLNASTALKHMHQQKKIHGGLMHSCVVSSRWVKTEVLEPTSSQKPATVSATFNSE